jgi:hypothetical protein
MRMGRRSALAPLLAALALAACHRPPPASDATPDAAASQPGPPPSAPANATQLPIEAIEAVVNPQKLPVYTGPTGSVEGTIHVVGPASPDKPNLDFALCPDGRAVYGKLFREGAPAPDGSRALPDAVVAVTGYAGYYVPERNQAKAATINGCAFSARTITMTFGQRLEVANKTPQLWAPTLTQAPMPALMFATSNGDAVRLYPPHPGYYTMVDGLKHSYASADVYAFLHPLHAVSDLTGHYRIDGVPVGKVKVNARLAALATETSADVEILANVVQKVDLTLKYVPKVVYEWDGSGPIPHNIH